MQKDFSDEEMVDCYYRGTKTTIMPQLFFSILTHTQYDGKKFVRYKSGAKIYSMSEREFNKLAHDAGAVYKINKMALVKLDVLDDYLEYFRQG